MYMYLDDLLELILSEIDNHETVMKANLVNKKWNKVIGYCGKIGVVWIPDPRKVATEKWVEMYKGQMAKYAHRVGVRCTIDDNELLALVPELQYLEIHGGFNDTMSKLTHLQHLVIGDCGGRKIDIIPLASMPTLRHLELDCEFKEEDFHGAISQLTHLRRLIINQGNVTNGAIKSISKLSCLTHLNISNGELENDAAREVAKITTLQHLEIGNHFIEDAGATEMLRALKLLRHLDISENDLTEMITEELSESKELQYLDISYNVIGNATANVVCKLPKLRHLLVSDTYMSPEGVMKVAELVHLTHLEISRNCIYDIGVIAIASNLEHLRHLKIASTNIGLAGLKAVAKLKHLLYIDIGDNNIHDGICDSTITNFMSKGMRHLRIKKNRISWPGATIIAQTFPDLEELDLSFNPIGTNGAWAVSSHLRKLRHLCMAGCNFYNDSVRTTLTMQDMPDLKYLSMYNNGITANTIPKWILDRLDDPLDDFQLII